MPDACEETCGDIYYELTEDRLWILISAADDSFGTGGHEILACLQLYKNGIRPAQNKVKMHICCPDFCYPPFLLLVRMSLFLKHILMFASGSRLSFFHRTLQAHTQNQKFDAQCTNTAVPSLCNISHQKACEDAKHSLFLPSL